MGVAEENALIRCEMDPAVAKDVVARLVARTRVDPAPEWMPADTSPCISFMGALVTDGTAVVAVQGRNMAASRAIWLATVGPIPLDDNGRGLNVFRHCRNKRCINVKHFELVTHAESRRRQAAYKTHCAQGHALTDDNVAMRAPGSRGVTPYRQCIRCEREVSRRSYHKRKAETAAEAA